MMQSETIRCRRCAKDSEALQKAPFRNELGERILGEICGPCWKEWLQHQTLLINHYGLDPLCSRAVRTVRSALLPHPGSATVDAQDAPRHREVLRPSKAAILHSEMCGEPDADGVRSHSSDD
jgi:Fe-S cluster biosynthesis and repair protein YggX